MFHVGDQIIYGRCGACIIEQIAELRFGRTVDKYYVLRSKYQNSAEIFVPVSNAMLCERMRPMLTRDEADHLLDSFPSVGTMWIEDTQERKKKFDEMMKSGDPAAVVIIIRTLAEHRLLRIKEGKSLHVSDDSFLREARKLLCDVLATPLLMTPSEVYLYLKNRISDF